MEVNSLLTGRRGVSLPFTDYCEPITSGGSDLNELIDYMKNYAGSRKWKYIEYRGGADIIGIECSLTYYYRHVLQLSSDSNVVFEQLKSSTRRNIRKAEREGVTVTLGSSLPEVETFYGLHCITRKKHGLPPQPSEFFNKIHEHIISNDYGQVALAHYQGRAIAGAIYFHFNQEAIYKYGASLSGFLHLRPNDLLMWSAIREYCRNGSKTFCFGRTEPNNEGLRHFKNGWGTKEKMVHYYRYDIGKKEFIKEQSSHSGITTAIFRMTPLFVSRWLGRVLYRHVG
jgi:lipid II:glycine glycyltransferase (peptidoglycan interpeptide bridge formation enzyme)